jgi:hypothetical protein
MSMEGENQKEPNPFKMPRVIVILLIIFVILALSLSVLWSQRKKYNSQDRVPISKKANDEKSVFPIENVDERSKRMYQYDKNINLPDYIERKTHEISYDENKDTRTFEYVAVRVVSTGEISETTIKDNTGEPIASIVQLNVLIDDKNDVLDYEGPLSIALRVFPLPENSGDITPIDMFDIAMDIEEQKLRGELDSGERLSDVEYNEKYRIIKEKLDLHSKTVLSKMYDREYQRELFAEGTLWNFVPFVNEADYLREYEQKSDYLELLKEYYPTGSSGVLDLILSDNLENVKNPILVLDFSPNYGIN